MKKIGLVVLTVCLVLILAISAAFRDQLAWRSQIMVLKAKGELDFITWSETFRWMLPNSPVYLSNLLSGRNPNVALTNSRYVTLQDALEGERIYRLACATCHGASGEGVSGPALNVPSRIRSDWALYRTIERGIPGTSMPAHDLPDRAIWQLITHITSLSPAARDSGIDQGVNVGPVSYSRIKSRANEADNWLTYSGSYNGWRFSDLSEIHTGNANELVLKWAYQSDTSYRRFQVSPIVVGGVMFVSEPHGQITALDAASGNLLWRFERSIPETLVLCCGVMNRGVAILDETVFVTTIDAHLLALDMRSGELKWEVEVADHSVGYSITSAPLAIDGLVVTGVAGGETGTRGFLDAYDVQTGERAWRFYTIPAPGVSGSETWDNDLWKIGGASTWMIGSYDPELDLLYWGTSHSVHEPEVSHGSDKLYGSSILAIRAATGELVWHFQATPDDIHGFDAAQVPILIDVETSDGIRRLLLNANRNGYYYVLDRETGEFVSGSPFVKVTWSLGLDDHGRPMINPDARPTRSGTLSWPNSVGATNWWPPTFSPLTRRICFPVVDGPSVFYAQDAKYTPGRPYVPVVGRQSFNEPWNRSIRCLDSLTGELDWEKKLAQSSDRSGGIVMAGLLMTAGNLLFGSDGYAFFALNAFSGAELWRINTGGNIIAPPVTYRAGDQQYVAVASGRMLMVFGLLTH